MGVHDERKYVLKCTECDTSIYVRIPDTPTLCNHCGEGMLLPLSLLEEVAPKDIVTQCKAITTYLTGPAEYKHSDSVLREVHARIVELSEVLKGAHWRAIKEIEEENKKQEQRSFSMKHSSRLVKMCAARRIAEELGEDGIVEYITLQIEKEQKR